jgi:hypothetical protein
MYVALYRINIFTCMLGQTDIQYKYTANYNTTEWNLSKYIQHLAETTSSETANTDRQDKR